MEVKAIVGTYSRRSKSGCRTLPSIKTPMEFNVNIVALSKITSRRNSPTGNPIKSMEDKWIAEKLVVVPKIMKN
jgi:hypothetical protein